MKISILFLFTTCLFVGQALAQWSGDSTINTRVCNVSGDQQYPEIAGDGAGGAIIVWQDDRDASSKIYAQRLDSSGVARWQTNGIPVSTADKSRIPVIASDGAGGAIIAWFDMRNGWPNSTVAAQRVNGNGDMLWQANGVILASAASSWSYPDIAGYGSEGAVVTWIGVNGEIYVQKIDTSGVVQWTDGGVRLTQSGGLPRIIVDNAGGAIVTWDDYNEEHTAKDIFAQRVNADGVVMWHPEGDTICDAVNYQQHPEAVPDGNGGAIITWLDRRSGDSNYAYAQRIDAGGLIQWARNGVKVASSAGTYRTRIAGDGAGGAYVAWSSATGDVYAQRINGMGELLWSGDVAITWNRDGFNPMIVEDGGGGLFVSWRPLNAITFIGLQHLTADGSITLPGQGRTVTTGNSLKDFHVLIADGRGGAIIAWKDGRQVNNTDIYAQRMFVPGAPTDISEDGYAGRLPQSFALDQNYPNPFNPETVIRYSLLVTGYARLAVYDILGREVATLVDGVEQAGEHTVSWNAADQSGGIYFCRLEAVSVSDPARACVQVRKMIYVK